MRLARPHFSRSANVQQSTIRELEIWFHDHRTQSLNRCCCQLETGGSEYWTTGKRQYFFELNSTTRKCFMHASRRSPSLCACECLCMSVDGECLQQMKQRKRHFWIEIRPHVKNGHWKRDVIMRLLWYNRGFGAGWPESNMNERYCKSLSPFQCLSLAVWISHLSQSDRIWMHCCHQPVPKDWPQTSISNHVRQSTTVRAVSYRCSKRNRWHTPNDWSVSVAICLPLWNRKVRNSVTSELRSTNSWASHGFAISSNCCTNVVCAWRNWNQVRVTSRHRQDTISNWSSFFFFQRRMRRASRWHCICIHSYRSHRQTHGSFWSRKA